MRTPITYYGGKQQLAAKIISMMPAHRIYCEPFFGGGAVFFQKPKSYLEVINDKNDRLITFYRQVQEHFDEDLFELDSCVDQCACEDTYTEEEIGYMNYAKHSAMHKIGLTNEFITLEREHTKALIEQDDFEFDINEEGTV